MTTRILSTRGSKRIRKAKKPSKPRRDFPLYAHSSGQWAKKVRGKLHYFGKWDDPAAAEGRWDEQKAELLVGGDPIDATQATVADLANAFLESKELQRDRGELSKRSFNDYFAVCEAIVEYFGKTRRLVTMQSIDFERYRNGLPKTWGPTTVNNHLRLARVVLKYANDVEIAGQHTLRYAIGLKAVPKATVRKHEAKKPAKEFSAEEIWRLIHEATPPVRAFIWLGINCAYGPADINRLRITDIDFKNEWIGEPRGKTGVARGCWLWPETTEAIQEAIRHRPTTDDPDLDGLAFITAQRRPWAEDGSSSNPLTQAFLKLKKRAKIDKRGVGHYGLRHTFETVAGDTKDQVAVNFAMGHHDHSMSGVYREGIDPSRIRAVCEFVRQWLLDGKPTEEEGGDQ